MAESKKYGNAFEATWVAIMGRFNKQKEIGKLEDDLRADDLTVMITGSSSGLGYATAVDMANRGASVVMAVRSGIPEKGEAIKEHTGSEKVSMYYVDLSDLDSIDSFCDTLVQDGIKIDVLISNAAMVPSGSRTTKQGLEEMFVVNYLSKFYLIRKLLSAGVIASSKRTYPRIVIVSSESHRNPDAFDWDSFGKPAKYNMKDVVKRYGYFKLLLTTFAVELSRRLNAESGRTARVSSLCPGPVNSNIAREAPAWSKPLLKIIFGIFFRSPEKACRPVSYLALESEHLGNEFKYLYLMSEKEADGLALDPKNGSMLWERSEAVLGFRLNGLEG